MADGISVNIVGIADLQRSLRGLVGKEQRRVLRKSLTKGAAVTRKAMRRLAPRGPTGNLRKSVKSKVRVNKRIAVAVVTPRHEIAPHRHLVIRGTKLRAKSSGQSTGRMPGEDFVAEAFDATSSKAGDVMLDVAADMIEQAWNRG